MLLLPGTGALASRYRYRHRHRLRHRALLGSAIARAEGPLGIVPGSEAELHDADEDAGAFANWDVVNYGARCPPNSCFGVLCAWK